MEEMYEPLNLIESDNLKLSSMHHFNLKPREVVQVYKFYGRQNCHALYIKLLNYISLMNEKRKRSKEGPQTEIIAPKPFANCIVKKCNMTYKGVVETRAAKPLAVNTDDSISCAGVSRRYDLKFNGIIFPQPINRICDLSRAVLNQS